MAESTNYQCPNCNGRLHWNGELGQLQCEFCESTFSPEEVEAIYAERQARADAKASGDRAEKAGRHARPDERAVEAEQTRARAKAQDQAYQQAIAEGKTPDEAVALAKQAGDAAAAAVAAGAGASTGATGAAAAVSAAEASQMADVQVNVKGPVEGEDPIDTYLRNAKWDSNDVDSMRSYNCPSCGAQLMVDQVTAVTSCPYCGNNTVVPGQLSDVLKPDYVIPFKLDKNAAIAALKQYYQGKKFLPDAFTDQNHIEEIQGVYVPFWLYSGTGEGQMTMEATNSRTWSDSKNMYTETDHYQLYREGNMQFRHVPVDGSTKMPDAHMDAIEPFDYSEMVPFSVAYLPGYLTDRYDQGARTCQERAVGRVRNTVEAELEATASGYETIEPVSSNAALNLSEVAYALLPVWMLHTKWNGQDYLFAMNGQTGKLIGDLPIDKGKVRKRFILLFLPILLVIALIVVFVFGGYSL